MKTSSCDFNLKNEETLIQKIIYELLAVERHKIQFWRVLLK